jgi:hypothetical protein
MGEEKRTRSVNTAYATEAIEKEAALTVSNK